MSLPEYSVADLAPGRWGNGEGGFSSDHDESRPVIFLVTPDVPARGRLC